MTQSGVWLHYKPMQCKSSVCFRGFRQGECWIPLLPHSHAAPSLFYTRLQQGDEVSELSYDFGLHLDMMGMEPLRKLLLSSVHFSLGVYSVPGDADSPSSLSPWPWPLAGLHSHCITDPRLSSRLTEWGSGHSQAPGTHHGSHWFEWFTWLLVRRVRRNALVSQQLMQQSHM